jgi:hypothetical protein
MMSHAIIEKSHNINWYGFIDDKCTIEWYRVFYSKKMGALKKRIRMLLPNFFGLLVKFESKGKNN